MKQFKVSVIALFVLLALLLIYFFVYNYEPPNRDKTVLFYESEENIVEFKVLGNSYYNDDGVWRVRDKDNIELSQEIFTSLIQNAAYIKADKIIDENPDNYEKYKLKTPVDTIMLKTKSNKEYNFELGSKTPTAEGFYYFKIKDEPQVYIVNNYKIDGISKSLGELRENRILNMSGINEISVKNKEEELVFSIQEDIYKMTQPVEKEIDGETFKSQVITRISPLVSDSFIDENIPDFSAPDYTLRVKNEETEETIMFLEEDDSYIVKKNNNYYKISKQKGSFLIDMFKTTEEILVETSE